MFSFVEHGAFKQHAVAYLCRSQNETYVHDVTGEIVDTIPWMQCVFLPSARSAQCVITDELLRLQQAINHGDYTTLTGTSFDCRGNF